MNTYLSFIICEELYAVNVSKVLEVLQKQQITKVPNAPKSIKGIINFRGDVVPVFEARNKLNLPERPSDGTYVIIVFDLSKENEQFRIGAIVDKVKDVISVEDSEIQPVPPMAKNFDAGYIQGIYKLKNDFIMLLDIKKVFTIEELFALEQEQSVQ